MEAVADEWIAGTGEIDLEGLGIEAALTGKSEAVEQVAGAQAASREAQAWVVDIEADYVVAVVVERDSAGTEAYCMPA
jgi:hypothetical protein